MSTLGMVEYLELDVDALVEFSSFVPADFTGCTSKKIGAPEVEQGGQRGPFVPAEHYHGT